MVTLRDVVRATLLGILAIAAVAMTVQVTFFSHSARQGLETPASVEPLS